MSNNPILGKGAESLQLLTAKVTKSPDQFGVNMSNHYQATNIEEPVAKIGIAEPYRLELEKKRKEREEMERNQTFYEKHYQIIHIVGCATILILIGLFALYVLSILIGIFVIVANYVFETTIVALVGRAIYNKNFPICSNKIYQGLDCYTQTSTYCT